MVTPGMRRYRVRTAEQAALVGPGNGCVLAVDQLFASSLSGSRLRLEIGFGHGEYITAMAAEHPHERFIGV